jgi:hypothetical protein
MQKSIRQRIELLERSTTMNRSSDWEPVLVILRGGTSQHAVNIRTGETNHDHELVEGLFKSLRNTGSEIHVEYQRGGGYE